MRIIYSVTACALVLMIAGLGPAHAKDRGPVKVGFLTVLTGPLAAGGKQIEEGLQLCMDQHGGTMAGRKVKIITEDTAGQPAIAKNKTQELVEREGVDALIGPLAAFEALAIDSYIRRVKIPIISPSAAADDLTQRHPNPWFVRAVGTASQPYQPFGQYVAKTLGYKKVAIIADDFAFGHEIVGGFQRTFEENGGKVVQKLWPPLNTADYGSYIAQIDPDVDAVFAAFAGGNGIKFVRQYRNYGMQMPLLGSMTTVDEGILKNIGDPALGIISAGWYSAAIKTPANEKFVKAVRAKYGREPGYYTVGGVYGV